MSLFGRELSGTTPIGIGQRTTLAVSHDRTLTLAASDAGAHLVKGPPRLPPPSRGASVWRRLRRFVSQAE